MDNSKPMRVAQIIGKMLAGGVENVVFNYYKEIDHNLVQFDFYYDSDSTVEPPEELIKMGARFIKIPPYQKIVSYLLCLYKYFKENNYLIVHSHLNTLSVFPLFVAWICKVPVRVAHNHSVPGGTEYLRNLLKKFLKNFSKVFATDYFACSEKAAIWMFGKKTYKNNKVNIIKNAVDFSRFENNKVKNKKDEFIVGHVGRFTYAKNHKFLIDVFEKLSRIKKDSKLILVGDGELYYEIYDYIKSKQLEKKVILKGKETKPEKYYKMFDVMVIPSIFEGLSLAAIESQASGIPTIVSDCIPEEVIISNGLIRKSLKDPIDDWVNDIIKIADIKVSLNERKNEYDIKIQSQKLNDWYMKRLYK